MAPTPGVVMAGAAVAAISASSSSSWSSYSYSRTPTTPINSTAIVSILNRCNLTDYYSLSSLPDTNAREALHCLAEFSIRKIRSAYWRPFWAYPFSNKAIATIVFIVLFGLLGLFGVFVIIQTCVLGGIKRVKGEREVDQWYGGGFVGTEMEARDKYYAGGVSGRYI